MRLLTHDCAVINYHYLEIIQERYNQLCKLLFRKHVQI